MSLIQSSTLTSFSIHRVGNRQLDEPLILSRESIQIEDKALQQLFTHFFTRCFKIASFWHFDHSISLEVHPVYVSCKRIFENPYTLHEHSIGLAKYLYEMQDHPATKAGDVFISYFDEIQLEDSNSYVQAVGIYKTENQETLIQLQQNTDQITPHILHGINPNKMDKACLVLNQKEKDGYDVLILDNTNKQDEAKYWKEKFLSIKKTEDKYHHTEGYMKVVKSFISEKLHDTFEADKTVEVELAQKTVNYFKNNELFNFDQFATDTLANNPELIESFRMYKKEFQEKHDMHLADEFEISKSAFRKQEKYYKSVIKLDKNFHIYVHGDRRLIERGYDEEKGMYYYKTYFKNEE